MPAHLLLEVKEHPLVALLVQHRHLLGALGLVDLAALVALSLEQLEEECLVRGDTGEM